MEPYLSIILSMSLFIGLAYVFKMLDIAVFGGKNKYLPYHQKNILTNAEYKFYMALKPVMDSKSYIICPKVGLKDLFEVNAGEKERQKHFGRISQKHIDFLICDEKLKPLFAIELDDRSHNRKDVKERDQFKNDLFTVCKFPLYRVPTNVKYSVEYLNKYITYEQAETLTNIDKQS